MFSLDLSAHAVAPNIDMLIEVWSMNVYDYHHPVQSVKCAWDLITAAIASKRKLVAVRSKVAAVMAGNERF